MGVRYARPTTLLGQLSDATMPSLTTQSIGATVAPMVNSPTAAQAARASQNAVVAGIQKNLNQQRASESATALQSTKRRSIQDEVRTEGVFEEGAGEEQKQHDSPDATPTRSKGFTRIA